MLRPHTRRVRSPGPTLVIAEPESKWAPHPQDLLSCPQDTRPGLAVFLEITMITCLKFKKDHCGSLGCKCALLDCLWQALDPGAAGTPAQREARCSRKELTRGWASLHHLLVVRTGRTLQAHPQEFIVAQSRPVLSSNTTPQALVSVEWKEMDLPSAFPGVVPQGPTGFAPNNRVLKLNLGETRD